MKTANSAFQHDLIRHSHSIRYAYRLIDRGDDKEVEIPRKSVYTCAIPQTFKLLRAKSEHCELLESRIIIVYSTKYGILVCEHNLGKRYTSYSQLHCMHVHAAGPALDIQENWLSGLEGGGEGS